MALGRIRPETVKNDPAFPWFAAPLDRVDGRLAPEPPTPELDLAGLAMAELSYADEAHQPAERV